MEIFLLDCLQQKNVIIKMEAPNLRWFKKNFEHVENFLENIFRKGFNAFL